MDRSALIATVLATVMVSGLNAYSTQQREPSTASVVLTPRVEQSAHFVPLP